MFASSRPLFFTLFFAITLLITLAPTADANGNVTPAHRRQVGRMLKKRAPMPVPADPSQGGILPIGVGQDPNKQSETTTSTSTSAASSATSADAKTTSTTGTDSAAATSTSTSTSSATTTGTSDTTALSTTTTGNLTTTSTTSTTSSTSSTTSTTTTSSLTSQTLAVTDAPVTSPSTTRTPTTVTLTNTLQDTSPTESDTATTNGATSGIGKTTLTVIIVIASCIGGAIIIWTIIRKWKFSPSAEFEERMQPIDWQPTAEHVSRDDGIPGSLRRVASNASHGSFHSGSDHDGRAYGGYGATSDQGHGNNYVADLPQHDFTAGPAHLAPVGGYADLARGPSPQPQMTEARGYGYDTYGPRY